MAKVRRSSSDPMVIARARGPEFTNVSDETERKIPFRTWLTCAAVSMVDVLSLVGILVLVSRQFWNWKHPPRIYGHSWGAGVWRGLSIWSPSIGIVILFFVMLWSVPLLYRFLVETVAKHPPQYTPYPSELGLWNPLGHGLEDDGEEYERDAPEPQTADLNLWDKAHGRERRRTLPDFLLSEDARRFYRAVTADPPIASFSESGARQFNIRPLTFRKHIRDAFRHREMATWKNERAHNQGVDLTDDAMRTMELLGRHSPPPRKRT